MSLFDVLNLKIDLVPMGCFDPAFGYFGVLMLQTLGVIGIALVLFLWRNIRIRAGCGSRTTTDVGDDDGRVKADGSGAELSMSRERTGHGPVRMFAVHSSARASG